MGTHIRPHTVVLGVGLALALLGCSKISALDPPSKAPPLPAAEQAAVREQVKKARGEKEWKAAWDQEVAAGADRAVLEQIALEALEDDDGDAADMFRELRKGGGVSADGRRRVAALMQVEESNRRWSRALEMALATADDPPRYAEAWALYRRAPPSQSPGLLEDIYEAREDLAREAASAPGAGG